MYKIFFLVLPRLTPLIAVDFDTTQNFFFFDTRYRTLVNVTFICVQKVCLCVSKQTQKRNFKIGLV